MESWLEGLSVAGLELSVVRAWLAEVPLLVAQGNRVLSTSFFFVMKLTSMYDTHIDNSVQLELVNPLQKHLDIILCLVKNLDINHHPIVLHFLALSFRGVSVLLDWVRRLPHRVLQAANPKKILTASVGQVLAETRKRGERVVST